ncbi:hypothetical protein G9Q38_10905 [Pusillimonas sp. DMV24BSW_D]|uniref:hypothetical protein n=1 Tax=Neopusillimonas aestuarii TaxID=2716226 RepID=UPI00140DC5FE|nr:hypothetical protein [Pusillimonas sp. DMV24BSW_D]QIM49642.1 hypothetical protein G9Q38_10905 [Pusillimonas sp. DMV24BSW_D]
MPGKKSRLAYSLATVAAMVALQAPLAVAAEPNNAETQVDRSGKHDRYAHQRHARSQQRDIAFMIPGYGPVGKKTFDSLKLTDSQQQKVNAAQAEQQALRAAHKSTMKSNMQARFAQLEEGRIDPRAALQAMQATQQEMSQRRLDVAEKWLQAWEALEADQQKVLTQALADRHEHRKDKMQRHSAS